jgi:hypothetical protein
MTKSLSWEQVRQKTKRFLQTHDAYYAVLEYVDRLELYKLNEDTDKFDFHYRAKADEVVNK